ncbi:MAG: orotidine-5'-phosphate decarboxylase [Phycisphaerae bacterium]|jgi:orotidine-5'-phosphate decarboxylase|nr:orotidine-5'-phosphate decarboxylase [Phycisphaerae bacterium]MCZ2400831.1 orotidine-5'-phosphate decarboxylase [Phycisphaerae bacterium]NUQ48368.1 orotidine-5'-phosphate decarboxylase [Phycisphaerae bacterium]
MPQNFQDRLAAAIQRCRTPAVVGIDPVYESLPPALRREQPTVRQAADQVHAFCRTLIDIAAAHAPAVKLNSAFFEALYEHGVATYYRLVRHAHARGLLVIGDIKRGDIGSTARLYARGHLAAPPFADVDADCIPDAVTLAGYLGEGAVRPFVEAAAAGGRGVYVLVRPSDPGADEIHGFGGPAGRAFYQHMAELVARWGGGAALVGQCGLSCVGAVVAPKDAASTSALRNTMPVTPWLVPGYGAQGAGVEACRPCFLPGGRGAIINASRSVIYAFSRPELAARGSQDWEACVDRACAAFAADVAPLAGC